jgi:adenosine kinase
VLEWLKYLIITRGEKGAVVYGKGIELEILAVKAHTVLDPTGAGDAFRGGLLKGLLHDLPIEISVQLASLVGCYAVEHVGTQTYHFTPAEFKQRFIANYGNNPDLDKLY